MTAPETAGQAAYEALQASAQRNHPEYPGISGVAWENIDRLEPLKQADYEAAAAAMEKWFLEGFLKPSLAAARETGAIAAAAPAPAAARLSESQQFQVSEARDILGTWDLNNPGGIGRETVLADQVRTLLAIVDQHPQPQAAPELAAAMAQLADEWLAKHRKYAEASKQNAGNHDYARAQNAIGLAYKRCANQLRKALDQP